MKGKYSKKKKNTGFRWILVTVLIVLIGIAALWIAAANRENEVLPQPEQTQGDTQTTGAAELPETTVPATVPAVTEAALSLDQPIDLGGGVYLEQVKSYTGTYMEDGSDQVVSDVMMILVNNMSGSDIQLMNIELTYPEGTFYFQLTNLATGGKAVLLEKNRAPMPRSTPTNAVATNTALFKTPMTADFERFEISGADGVLNVKNISGGDITGNIYVYYKYKIQDLFYGGITFRVQIEGGLKDGEIRQIMTNHYNPENCEIVMIETLQPNGN